MKRLVRFAVSLYPRPWRDRYEAEFMALLEDLRPHWMDLFDIWKGALAMRLSMNPAPLLIICALLGALVAVSTSLLVPRKFVSTYTLRAGDMRDAAGPAARAARQVLDRPTLTQMIVHHSLYDRGRNAGSIDSAIAAMRNDIRFASGVLHPEEIQISFIYADPVKAQAVARELSERIARQTGFELGGRPTLAKAREGSRRLLFAGIGLAVGAAIGVVAWHRLRHRTISLR